jgi:antitoxin (DNA-binding transcriptional repressor) of toxin-antitoxin stability system
VVQPAQPGAQVRRGGGPTFPDPDIPDVSSATHRPFSCNLSRVTLLYEHELTDAAGGPVADALAEVEAGEIAYLTRAGQPVAALVPIDELTALQHAADTAILVKVDAMRSGPAPLIPQDVIEAMMDADDATHDAMAAALDAHAGTELSPADVTALWERIRPVA